MRIDHLKYFVSLDDAQSFSEAARLSNISQQGYSRAIASLEKILGCQLVERSRQGSCLTGEGISFMRHAKRIVAEYDSALLEIRDLSSLVQSLSDFDGKVVFTNACMVSIGARLLEKGFLSKAEVIEIGLSDISKYDADPNCIVIADISPQIYPDFETAHHMLPIATGRVGIIVHGKLLPTDAENPIWESLETLPLGMLDCDASIEIYEELFKELDPKYIRLKSANNNILERSLAKGELALMCDSFSWQCFPEEIHRNAHIRFIPLRKVIHSVFGMVRSSELEITNDDFEFIAALHAVLDSDDEECGLSR